MSQIMPFVQVHIANEIEREKEKSPEFEKAWDEGWDEGWGKAWDKAKFEDIKNLMKKLDLSAEKSMEILEIPETERELYKKALNEEAVVQV